MTCDPLLQGGHPTTTPATGSNVFKGALCAEVIRLRVSYNQNDETLSRNSLRYLSKAI